MSNSGVLKQGSSNRTTEEVPGNICKVEHILIPVTLESFGEREQNPCRFSLSKSYPQVKLKKSIYGIEQTPKELEPGIQLYFFL